jgi:uncharacterized spore protein YtfJ
MGSVAIIEAIRDSVVTHTDVKALYGEPIEAQGKTIIPVAKIMYGFGAGAGNARGQENSGGGGGGGVRALPLGVVEVTPERTRFVAISDRRKLAAAALGGMIFGRFLLRRFRR